MEINRIVCSQCFGNGFETRCKISEVNADGIGTLKSEEVVCECCSGKGYIEYSVFTVEEAKAILKYCGLSTES